VHVQPAPGSQGSVRICQIHLTLRLMVVRSRSGIPKPPSRSGLHTRAQLTWQCPPLASALPVHKNPLKILYTSEVLLLKFKFVHPGSDNEKVLTHTIHGKLILAF
jgi:hypothetical protein